LENAKRLLEYGKITSNNITIVLEHWVNAFANFITGDLDTAQKNCKLAIESAFYPIYAQNAKTVLGCIFFLPAILKKLNKF
jgi:hypothetical protein